MAQRKRKPLRASARRISEVMAPADKRNKTGLGSTRRGPDPLRRGLAPLLSDDQAIE
jgi:hypothetical protein